ncbi:hypothetical protein IJI72_01955 [Candidatus Saccharibacteria bacterium]|nr:hypothetical protein [Candidatus Saccharibacteria bacterium]
MESPQPSIISFIKQYPHYFASTILLFLLIIALLIPWNKLFSPDPTAPSAKSSLTSSSLSTALNSERDSIETTFLSKYSFVAESFTIKDIVLFRDNIAGLTLTYGLTTYRTLLQKQDDSWTILAPPEIVLSYADFPDIDQSIIKDLNNLE